MGKCFVTKLSEAVNNPNLPVLEQMQQFTIDAIAASGNNNMTDAQKWALNHFFYSLEKFKDSDDAIWNKLAILGLPLIAGSVNNSTIDYLDNTNVKAEMFDISNLTLENNGYKLVDTATATYLIISKQTDKNINANNVFMCNAYSEFARNLGGIEIDEGTNTKLKLTANPYVSPTSNQNWGFIITGKSSFYAYAAKLLPAVIRCGNVNGYNSTNNAVFYGVNEEVIVKGSTTFNTDNYEEISFENQHIGLRMSNTETKPIQVFIAGEALTESQTIKVITAVNDLRNAFYTQV